MSRARNSAAWLGRIGWALVGALALYVLAWRDPISYPEVIVPAARILEREVPSGPPRIIERVRYVYLTPDVRAVAPRAVQADVAAFCRPITVVDTVRVPSPTVVRTGQHTPAWFPLVRDHFFVSSMNGYGDLIGEDFRVRPGFGFSAGLEEPYRTTVRYPRWAPAVEVFEGFLWYGAFRLVEAVVRY